MEHADLTRRSLEDRKTLYDCRNEDVKNEDLRNRNKWGSNCRSTDKQRTHLGKIIGNDAVSYCFYTYHRQLIEIAAVTEREIKVWDVKNR